MDDPLRPKTVPLSAETILWFEFLLDPNLLTTHLSKENPIPTPIELISKFLSISPEPQNTLNDVTPSSDIESALNANEGLNIGLKQLALKILTLKVASTLKWDLGIFEKNLSLQKQVQLLSDLCSVTSDKLVNLPLSHVHEVQMGPNGSKSAYNFALTLYHRWVLRAQVLKEIPSRIFKQGLSHVLVAQDQASSFRDDLFITQLDPFLQTSIDFLNQMCDDNEPFTHLTYDSFTALSSTATDTDRKQNFNSIVIISKTELIAQISFDLTCYYLYAKKYELAREKVIECRDKLALLKCEYDEKNANGENIGDGFLFCSFSEDELQGCLMACGVDENADIGLLHRMNESIINNYKNIADIFEEDNFKKEIPLVNRRIVEFDLEGACAHGMSITQKDQVIQMAAFNTIRSIIEDDHPFSFNDFLQKYQKQNEFSILLKTLISYLNKFNGNNIADINEKIKQFLRNAILISPDELNDDDIKQLINGNLFTNNELLEIKRLKHLHYDGMPFEIVTLTALCTMTDWKISETKMPNIELGALKRQLITCTNANAVRKLLVNIAALLASNPSLELEPWHINSSWIMPIQIKTVLMSLQRGFFQDFSYILVAKAKDMAARNEFKAAINMLNALKSEIQRQDTKPAIVKLSKLIEYEILLFQITQTLEEWPTKQNDYATMVTKCKQCFTVNPIGDNVAPRSEILDACAAFLINSNEASILATFDVRYPSSELYTAVSNAIIDLEQQKINVVKKVCRDAWDLVLPMFGNGNAPLNVPNNKRGQNAGNSGNNATNIGGTNNNNNGNSAVGASNRPGTPNIRDSPTIVVSTSLMPFLKKLRDPLPITIMLSLLARLHNILDDVSNMELNIEYMQLWPTTLSNASGYSTEIVSETLNNLLKDALNYYPQYVSWIRLKGDLEFRNENYESAMSSYVNAIITGSEYCTVNIQRQIDDYIVRRMIKCSSQLGCYMQAAILCQFFEEIDYSLAFKIFLDRSTFKAITEKSTYFTDAVDSYYNCIWDPTLLEFIINLENKKGEHKRKQQAIAVIGQLELNANNNDEVKREAASIRRIKFLRSLAKQYLL